MSCEGQEEDAQLQADTLEYEDMDLDAIKEQKETSRQRLFFPTR